MLIVVVPCKYRSNEWDFYRKREEKWTKTRRKAAAIPSTTTKQTKNPMTRHKCKQKTNETKKSNAIQTMTTINHNNNETTTKQQTQQKMRRDKCTQKHNKTKKMKIHKNNITLNHNRNKTKMKLQK